MNIVKFEPGKAPVQSIVEALGFEIEAQETFQDDLAPGVILDKALMEAIGDKPLPMLNQLRTGFLSKKVKFRRLKSGEGVIILACRKSHKSHSKKVMIH